MANYKKWENIEDSEEEEEDRRRKLASLHREEQEELRQEQEDVDKWLRRQEAAIRRAADEPQKRLPVPEMRAPKENPYRKLTKDERKVLSMLIVVSHFEEGETNLDRHPQML